MGMCGCCVYLAQSTCNVVGIPSDISEDIKLERKIHDRWHMVGKETVRRMNVKTGGMKRWGVTAHSDGKLKKKLK